MSDEPTLVGEAGPEWVEMSAGLRVYSNAELLKELGEDEP